jgi:cell division septation protein DedD
MQNQEYSGYIYQMLMEFGYVSIPELGTFALEYTEAQFQQFKTILHPPSTKVLFSRAYEPKFDFFGLLVETGMPRERASSLERQACEDFNISRTANKPWDINGLGSIVNNVFVDKDQTVFNRFEGLLPLSVRPLEASPSKIQHQDDYLFHLNKSYAVSQKDTWRNYLLPIIAALITLLFIIFWVFSPKGAGNQMSTEPTVITDTLADDSVEELENSLLPDESDLTTAKSKVNNDEHSSLHDGNSTTVTHSSQFASNDNNSWSVPTADGVCVLIVGSFKKESNAKKMLKRLKSQGYQTYSSTHQGLQRIGITYDCRANNPDLYKVKIRKQFNKNAWHLHDTI